MGLGLLLLASTGKENIITTNNPQITFFKKVYKKYNNFSFETIPQYFKSTPNFGRRVTVNISKTGDMINEISLYVELPDIPLSKHSVLKNDIKKFAWVDKIGFALIKFIDIEIGGILINRHYNDWLNIYFENNFPIGDFEKIIGSNVKLLNEYSNGKQSYKLHIPLKFFFNLEHQFALPIISITKQDVKIHVEFNDIAFCYKESPTHYFNVDTFYCLFKKGELLKQNVNGVKSIGEFVYFDVRTQRVYYNEIMNSFIIPDNNNTKFNIIGDESNFSMIPRINSIIVTDESYFFTNKPTFKDSYLLVNYVFLDNNEKWFFQNNNIEYVIPLVQNILEQEATSLNKNFRLNLSNPHKILYWRAQLNSEVRTNNHFNYLSYPLTDKPEPLIIKNKILINSIPRTEIDNFEFFTYLQNYINKSYLVKGLNQFSFCLHPNDNVSNGTLNFSRIDDAYIQLKLNKNINYQNTVNIRGYGIYYNILIIKNGSCSLKFSI